MRAEVLRSPVGVGLAAVLLGLLACLWLGVEAPDSASLRTVGAFFSGALHPAMVDPLTQQALLPIALRSAALTVLYGLAATSLVVLLGLPLGLAGTSAAPPTLRRAAMGLAAGARAFNGPLWALLLLASVGLSPVAGVIAIALPGVGAFARAVAALFGEAAADGPRAVREQGGSPLQALLLGAGPGVSAELSSFAMVRLECAVRTAAVLGFFGLPTLGVHIAASAASQDHASTWTFLYALLGTSLVLEALGSGLRRLLRKTPRGKALAWVGVGFAGLSLAVWLSPALRAPATGGAPVWTRLSAFAQQAFTPELLTIWSQARAWSALADTVALAVAAVSVAALLGALLAPLRPPLRAPIRGLLLCLRSIPEYVWAFIAVSLLGLGPLPAILALVLHNTGVLGRLGGELCEEQDPRPGRTVQEQGGGSLAQLLWGTWPQLRGRYLLYVGLRAEACLREAAVLGLTGVVSLGWLVAEARAGGRYPEMVGVLLLTWALFVGLTVLMSKLRRALRGGAVADSSS